MAKQKTKQKTRHADFLSEWEQIIATLTANAAEVPHLEAPRVKLEGFLETARSLIKEQDLHNANKQNASTQLDATMANGKKLATFLRTGIKEHFGNRSAKLVEFGLQPFRRRKAGETGTPEQPGQPQPEPPKQVE